MCHGKVPADPAASSANRNNDTTTTTRNRWHLRNNERNFSVAALLHARSGARSKLRHDPAARFLASNLARQFPNRASPTIVYPTTTEKPIDILGHNFCVRLHYLQHFIRENVSTELFLLA